MATAYISLLRGINVSGKNKIKMSALADLYFNLGFSDVSTYIQSGNVVFHYTESDTNMLAKSIKNGIKEKLGLDIEVIVKSLSDLEYVVNKIPFADKRTYITFLSKPPETIPYDELKKVKQDSESLAILNDVVYFLCPDGYGKTKLSNNFLEKQFGAAATTRNYKTVSKLLELAKL